MAASQIHHFVLILRKFGAESKKKLYESKLFRYNGLKGKMSIKIKTKVCSNCKVEKPTSEFNKQSSSPDNLKYFCKSCCKSKDAAVYLKNKKLYINRAIEWKRENKD